MCCERKNVSIDGVDVKVEKTEASPGHDELNKMRNFSVLISVNIAKYRHKNTDRDGTFIRLRQTEKLQLNTQGRYSLAFKRYV